MIAIINYGVGNLKSILKAVEAVGGNAKVTFDAEEIKRANGVILPGVGAFKTAIGRLRTIWHQIADIPKLGICLGMQLFATRSYEDCVHEGMNVIPGEVVRLPNYVGKVPHMGWNEVRIKKESELFDGIENCSMFYFVHSYYLQTAESYIVAETDYGINFPSAVEAGNNYGVQFHPEKSERTGLKILENFLRIVKA
jgi:glutamine amidotransferase